LFHSSRGTIAAHSHAIFRHQRSLDTATVE